MPPLARITDQTAHPGVIAGPGVATVLVGGLPVAVLSDNHVCSFPSGNPPSPVSVGSTTVLIGGMSAARLGDVAGCGANIILGELTVEVG
jgi:uncharacterized Zn-binding protein involved in type VI secretion